MEENYLTVQEKEKETEIEIAYQPQTRTVCTFKDRLKSKGVWVSVFGAIGLILNSFGLFAKWGIETEEWNLIINTVCGILVTFGILNNPTDCKHF